jgi:hypothetical protein
VCPGDKLCVHGGCRDACPVGETACGAACVDTTEDPLNCGGCNIRCGTGESCVRGDCTT